MLATAYVWAGKTHSCLSTGPFQAPTDWIPRHRWNFCRRQPRHSTGTPQRSSFQRPRPKTARLWVAVDFGLPFRPTSAEARGGCCSPPAAARGTMLRARPAEHPPARPRSPTRSCAPGMRGRSRRRREMRGALERGAPGERGPSAPPGGGRAAGEAVEGLGSPFPRESPARQRPRVPQGSHRTRRGPAGRCGAKCAVPPLLLRSAGSAGEVAEGMSAGGAEADSPPPRPCARFLLQ